MDKNNKNLEMYFSLVGKDSELARSHIEKLEFEGDAYLLNCIALTYRDQSLFKKSGETRKVLIKKYLVLAKEYNDKAFAIKPECIEILFLRGTIFNHLEDLQMAIKCFLEIIEINNLRRKKYNCGNESREMLMMIQNDAYFQLYRLFLRIDSKRIANKLLKIYKNGLKNGINTIYSPIEKFI